MKLKKLQKMRRIKTIFKCSLICLLMLSIFTIDSMAMATPPQEKKEETPSATDPTKNPPAQQPPDVTQPVQDNTAEVEDNDPQKEKIDNTLRENGINNPTYKGRVETPEQAENIENNVIDPHITGDLSPLMGENKPSHKPANDLLEKFEDFQVKPGDVVVTTAKPGEMYILRPDNPDNPMRYELVYTQNRPVFNDKNEEIGRQTGLYEQEETTQSGNRSRKVAEYGKFKHGIITLQGDNREEFLDTNNDGKPDKYRQVEGKDMSYWDEQGNPVSPLYSPFKSGKPLFVDYKYNTENGEKSFTFKDENGNILGTRVEKPNQGKNIYGHNVTAILEVKVNCTALEKGYEIDTNKLAPEFKNEVSAQLRMIKSNPDWFGDVKEITWRREYGLIQDSNGQARIGLVFSSVGYETDKLGLRQVGAVWDGEKYIGYMIDKTEKKGDEYIVTRGSIGQWQNGSFKPTARIIQGKLVNNLGGYKLKLDKESLKLEALETATGGGVPPSGGGGINQPASGNFGTLPQAREDFNRLRNMPLDERVDELANRGWLDKDVAEHIKGLTDEDAKGSYFARSLYLRSIGLDGEQTMKLLALLGNKDSAISYLMEILGISEESATAIYNTLINLNKDDGIRIYFDLLNYSDDEIQKYLQLSEPQQKEHYLRTVFGIQDEELIEQIINLEINEVYEFLKNRSLDIDVEELLGLKTDDDKEQFLIDYFVNEKGVSLEEAKEKANQILAIISEAGKLAPTFLKSIGFTDEEIEYYGKLNADYARLDYLINIIGLPVYTAQLIVGKMIDENGDLIDLPSDYLEPIFVAIENCLALAVEGIVSEQELQRVRAELINEVYQALYRGEIIPENAEEKIMEIIERLSHRR